MEIFGVLLNGYDECASVVSSEGTSPQRLEIGE